MCTTLFKILAKSCWNLPCYWKTPTSTMYQFCINYQLHSKQDSDFSLLKPLKVYKYIDIKVCLMLSYCTSWMFSMHGNFLGVHHKLVKKWYMWYKSILANITFTILPTQINAISVDFWRQHSLIIWCEKKCHAEAKKLGRRVKTPKNIVISKSFLTYHAFDRPFPPGSN